MAVLWENNLAVWMLRNKIHMEMFAMVTTVEVNDIENVLLLLCFMRIVSHKTIKWNLLS